MSLLTKLLPRRRTTPPVAEFMSQGHRVEEARLLGSSRCGLLSWTARIDGQKVKIYETHGALQSRFIEQVSRLPAIAEYFPKTLEISDTSVVVEWIEGEALAKSRFRTDPGVLRQIARFQARLHTLECPAISNEMEAPFSYRTYLLDRLERYEAPWPHVEAREALLAELERPPAGGRPRISQPDLTPQNVVLTTSGFKLIDNELLSYNDYPLIDLFNTHRVLGTRGTKKRTRLYLQHYVDEGGRLESLLASASFYEALWSTRMIGSCLQNGQISQARLLSEATLSESEPRHGLIEAAEGILAT